MFFKIASLALCVASLTTVNAAPVNQLYSDAMTGDAATSLAQNLVQTYPMTNGLLAPPYWSWISAGMHNSLIHYQHYTDDAQYDGLVSGGIRAQAGPRRDFAGPQTAGNDDVLWWGLSTISKAEFGPTCDEWLPLARNVFATVFARWQTTGSCSAHPGGIGWQIDPNSSIKGGYSYMNSITNGLAFQLAARLARHTGEQQYTDAANQIFDWSWTVGLIDNKSYSVYDGTHAPDCSDLDHTQWSYNNGVYLYGSAIMLDHTSDQKWQGRLDGFISAMQREFAPNNILTEPCERDNKCNTDQSSFKAYLARWLGQTAALIPSTQDKIMPVLQASAQAVADGKFDGQQGAGYEMGKLEMVQASLAKDKALPKKMGA